MHYTTEQKKQFLDEAISEYQTALEHLKKYEALLKRCDVMLCTGRPINQIHVFKGIKKIAKLTDSEGYNPLDWTGKTNKGELCVDVNDVSFFQLGDVKESVKGYYFR